MSRRQAVALAFVAVAVAAGIVIPLVALGSGKPPLTRAEYASRVSAIFVDVRTGFRRAGLGGDQGATSASLRRMKTVLDSAGARLKTLRAPADASSDHRALVEAVSDYSAQVDLVRASVDYGDVGTIAAHLRAVTAPIAIDRALRDLRAKGYRIDVVLPPAGTGVRPAPAP